MLKKIFDHFKNLQICLTTRNNGSLIAPSNYWVITVNELANGEKEKELQGEKCPTFGENMASEL